MEIIRDRLNRSFNAVLEVQSRMACN